ncbi:MAG TPA: metalloregulator ArsR/SmtB family transcription factor [Longimicrobiales bacterium]|nr:metalloregulator ArsR/SmtB family transcription factor [Longimicrobiales bacterium]
MPTYERTLHALADPTRRRLFEHLATEPLAVGELAGRVDVSQPAVSQHLKVLRGAGLVSVEAVGTRRIYRASPEGLASLRSWVEELWGTTLTAFARYVEEDR